MNPSTDSHEGNQGEPKRKSILVFQGGLTDPSDSSKLELTRASKKPELAHGEKDAIAKESSISSLKITNNQEATSSPRTLPNSSIPLTVLFTPLPESERSKVCGPKQ